LQLPDQEVSDLLDRIEEIESLADRKAKGEKKQAMITSEAAVKEIRRAIKAAYAAARDGLHGLSDESPGAVRTKADATADAVLTELEALARAIKKIPAGITAASEASRAEEKKRTLLKIAAHYRDAANKPAAAPDEARRIAELLKIHGFQGPSAYQAGKKKATEEKRAAEKERKAAEKAAKRRAAADKKIEAPFRRKWIAGIERARKALAKASDPAVKEIPSKADLAKLTTQDLSDWHEEIAERARGLMSPRGPRTKEQKAQEQAAKKQAREANKAAEKARKAAEKAAEKARKAAEKAASKEASKAEKKAAA
jgi:hypothetical protein